jgi:hypothetical protein
MCSMEPEQNTSSGQETVQEQLLAQQQALAKIYQSIEQVRKYLLWSVIGTVVTFVVPMIIMAMILPRVMGQYLDSINGLL